MELMKSEILLQKTGLYEKKDVLVKQITLRDEVEIENCIW
jgi:hypothetical protein